MDLHPFLVHFSLVLVPLGVAVDLFAIASGQRRWHGLVFLLVLGTAAASVHREELVAGEIERHEDLATVVLVLLLVTRFGRLSLQLSRRLDDWTVKLWIGVLLACCGLLWWTGHLGGELVYRHGVGVHVPRP